MLKSKQIDFILKYKKLFAFIFWVWISVILYFSLIPNNPKMNVVVNNDNFRLDYILHFLVYFGLALVYFLWKMNKHHIISPQHLIYFLIGGLVLGGLIEYVQTFIPGRTFNPNDFYSNAAGIIVGIIVPRMVLK